MKYFLGQQGKHAIHGFGRASEFYFDQPLKDLQPQQIALLVGMVRGASLLQSEAQPGPCIGASQPGAGYFCQYRYVDRKQAIAAKAGPLGVTDKPRSGGSRYPRLC